jgi:hypothetical protein
MSQKRTAAEADAAAAASATSQATFSGHSAAAAAHAPPLRPPTLVSGEELTELAETLGQFTPTIPDDVIAHYLNKAGLEASDPRV